MLDRAQVRGAVALNVGVGLAATAAIAALAGDVDNAAVPLAPKCTYTRPASTIGVGDAWLFLKLRRAELPSWNTSTLTTS